MIGLILDAISSNQSYSLSMSALKCVLTYTNSGTHSDVDLSSDRNIRR